MRRRWSAGAESKAAAAWRKRAATSWRKRALMLTSVVRGGTAERRIQEVDREEQGGTAGWRG